MFKYWNHQPIPIRVHGYKQILCTLLGFQGSMAFMTFQDNRLGAPTWMEFIVDSPTLWESVVIYRQFQQIDPEETEQMKRQNTFPKNVPDGII